MVTWGQYDFAEHVNKFGYNADIQAATPENLWVKGGDQSWPAAAAAITVVSTDAADDGDPVGTGARTVTVEYLDADWMLQEATVTMNGTTAVAVAASGWRCHRFYVATAGSGGTNAGALSVKVGATEVAHIAIGDGQTLQASYTVPADYSAAYLKRIYYAIAQKTAAVATFTVWQRPFGGAWRILRLASSADFEQEVFVPETAIHIAPKTDLYIDVDVSANGTAVAGGFDLILRR